MAKKPEQPETETVSSTPLQGLPPINGQPRTRLVNRNAHIKAASRIVAILQDIDPAKVSAILRTVQDALAEQPMLAFIPSDQI